jgi:hypothetical protein
MELLVLPDVVVVGRECKSFEFVEGEMGVVVLGCAILEKF